LNMADKNPSGSISREPGNSPLKSFPADYYPRDCGFWFTIPEGPDRGKKLFFQDHFQGKERPEKSIVLVHGNPECSWSFREIIDRIEQKAKKPRRIIAMDHIGFGLSDQATFEMVCPDHADNLWRLIRNLDLQKVTLVVHDWGGPIGIGAFLREPDRVSNLVILNTTVFPIPEKGFSYHKNYPVPYIPWSRFPSLFPDFLWGAVAGYTVYRSPAKAWRLISGLMIHILLSQLGIKAGPEKEARQVYEKQFCSKANTKSSKRMVRETAYWGRAAFDPGASKERIKSGLFFRFIQENLARAWGPEGKNIGVRALIGGWDPLGKKEVISQWLEHLPQLEGRVRIFDEVGHFVNLEKPDEIAETVLNVAGLG
jgi:cis-3-alkyl-4-acyloxetan-2-one decarboxylase